MRTAAVTKFSLQLPFVGFRLLRAVWLPPRGGLCFTAAGSRGKIL